MQEIIETSTGIYGDRHARELHILQNYSNSFHLDNCMRHHSEQRIQHNLFKNRGYCFSNLKMAINILPWGGGVKNLLKVAKIDL